jgi:hypothetical protein
MSRHQERESALIVSREAVREGAFIAGFLCIFIAIALVGFAS